MIEFTIDASELEKARRQLSFFPKLYDKAAKLATLRAMSAMENEIPRQTAERYYMKAARVKKAGKLNGTRLIYRGPRLKLSDYYLTPKKRPKGRQAGLSGAVMKRGGIKKIPKGFLIETNGKILPYIRTSYTRGDKWAGIKLLVAPAIPQIVKNPETLDAAKERGAKVFEKRFNHEVLRARGMIKT